MAETSLAVEGVKRPATALNVVSGEGPSTKKPKLANERDIDANVRLFQKDLGLPSSFLDDTDTARDECTRLTDDVDAGTHILILEKNPVRNAKCRAEKCLVEALHSSSGDKIQSSYRVNLQEVNPSGEHWSARLQPERRFFHLSCIEAIGVDLANLLRLQKSAPDRVNDMVVSIYRIIFHPAIEDWIRNKGKTYDIAQYNNDDYRTARKDYKQRETEWQFAAVVGNNCGFDFSTEPNIREYISDKAETTECQLSEVLLSLMGGDHLKARVIPQDIRIQVLEVLGMIPERLSETAIGAKLKKIREEDEAEEAQNAESDGNDEERVVADQLPTTNAEHGTIETLPGVADTDNEAHAGEDASVHSAN
ncbi:hypothetical protein LTR08_004059 [Meristemomyces frigidus]|nr:hypothetical protein LTR08_004059 [Meristemomyces frigidus]